MIRVINYLRANLIHKEIEDKIQTLLHPTWGTWNIEPMQREARLARVNRMLRRLEQQRRRTWAPWKDKK